VGGRRGAQQDRFALRELPHHNYRFTAPAVFMQDEVALGKKWVLALSARADQHSEYGFLATPRVSILSRPSPGWVLRLAAGTGTFAPTPFTEETEETGLSRVRPLHGLRAERARGASLDVTRSVGPIEITGTIFGSIVLRPSSAMLDAGESSSSMRRSTNTAGTELLPRYRRNGFVAMATHAWTRSTELDLDTDVRREVPLTPAHTASMNAIWEGEDWGRVGIELYYIGEQPLEENPHMAPRRPPADWRAGERRVGTVRLFINAENLDVRQTRHDPLVGPAPRPDGRWTVDAWARSKAAVNGGLCIAF
jgi:iron complex outermembrane receptor protein